jgi:AraC family transcriptional regulator of adaptative response / DNA-3-methyladenine glycosylase II
MIYCRPICPAKPKFRNIEIFKSPSAAEKAGYRACLRCRPDLAPGCKNLDTGKMHVSNALRLIEENASGNQSVKMLAQILGVSGRHLRRIFEKHLGASPMEIIQTQKLHLAKQLIQETDKPIGEIAYATGFNSVRRFNEVFKTTYRVPPSEFRKKDIKLAHQQDAILLSIIVRKPYDFKSVLSFLKRHAAYGIEKVDNRCYKRYIPNKASYSTLTVSINTAQDALQLRLKNCELNQIC